jgi:hypothetical protein
LTRKLSVFCAFFVRRRDVNHRHLSNMAIEALIVKKLIFLLNTRIISFNPYFFYFCNQQGILITKLATWKNIR